MSLRHNYNPFRYGLSFLPEQDGLRNGTFISAEAVAWMIKSLDGINTKIDAVQLGQVNNSFLVMDFMYCSDLGSEEFSV